MMLGVVILVSVVVSIYSNMNLERWILLAIVLALGLWAGIYLLSASIERERAKLLARYGDEQIVNRIMGKQLWVGQTARQLHDSLGAPADVDEKVLKTKRKETWKYGHAGANRYRLRVTLDNDEVVGWEEKS